MAKFDIKEMLENSDVLLAVGLIVVVVMMIIPLPPVLLDILLAVNISLSAIILLVCLYAREPLEYSSFPTILLVTTLFRLGLNVSTTRLILLYADAGEIVSSFGSFVVGGNYVVGTIIFIILVTINFMVITSGAGRVAEVAARFTLDAMPGKQLSIDADLNSGLIDEDEAKTRRKKIEREADFYGTMDGASKFVKGDATAGIIITLINIIGGLIIGMGQQGMDFMSAASTFTILTVGDGLVSQLPAIIISTATGLLVSRASGQDTPLSHDIGQEMFNDPRILSIIAGLLFVLGIMPGLPFMPFFTIGTVLSVLAFYKLKGKKQKEKDEEVAKQEEAADLSKQRKKSSKENVLELLTVEPMEIEIGYRLVPLLDIEQGGDLLERITQIRRQSALDLGIVLPSVRVRDNLQLNPNTYQIKIKGIPIESGQIHADRFLAMSSGVGDDPNLKGIKAVEPAFGLPALWIEEKDKEYAESSGFTVVSPSAVVSTHLTEVIKKNASEILTRADVQMLIDNIKKHSEELVEDMFKDNAITLAEVQVVLQNLLKERVSIRDLQTILETVSNYSRISREPDFLTEQSRLALARSICQHNQSDTGELFAVTLSANIENLIASSISQDGKSLSLDPVFTRDLVDGLNIEIEKILTETGNQPVILCSSPIRLALRRLLERTFPQIAIMSFTEVPANIRAKAMGVVKIKSLTAT